jgi:hypothetical protein
MSDTASIVERLGGPVLLSDRFKISLKAIEMWDRRGGIPSRWHIPILMLAKERRVALGMDELLSTHSQRAA